MMEPRSAPVAALLHLGAPAQGGENVCWTDYTAQGLTQNHGAELIGLVEDETCHLAPGDSAEVWAPLHAWRALAQLGAMEAVPALLRQLERDPDDDWLPEDFPALISMLGPDTIPALAEFLSKRDVPGIVRAPAANGLARLGRDHPDHRERCVRTLHAQLAHFRRQDADFNAFLVMHLVDLNATESAALIRKAFAERRVDIRIMGDIEDVEIELGLRTERATPAPALDHFRRGPQTGPLVPEPGTAMPAPAPRRRAKVGRNEPCPCGSGKKAKACCGTG